MEITILEIYEQNNQLRVRVETPYGVDNLGLSLNKKYLDPETDQPKWKKEVRQLLESKYGTIENRKKKSLEKDKDVASVINKKINLDDLS